MKNKNSANSYKFRGGARIGAWANTWPFGTLEIDQSALILRDIMLGKEFKFLKKDIKNIEIKKIVPLIGYGIRIYSKNVNQNDMYIFWYVGFNFQAFINILKEFKYL